MPTPTGTAADLHHYLQAALESVLRAWAHSDDSIATLPPVAPATVAWWAAYVARIQAAADAHRGDGPPAP